MAAPAPATPAPAPGAGQLRRLLVLVKPYRGYLIAGLIGVLVAQGLGLVFPLILGDLVDRAFDEPGIDAIRGLDRIALLLLGIFLARSLFHALRVYCLAAMGEGVVADLRVSVYRHLMTLPVSFFDGKRTGEITSRLTSDVAVVQGTLSVALVSTFAQGITLVGGTVLIVAISPQLAASVALFLPLAILIAVVLGRRIRRVSTAFQDQLADATGAASEAIAAKPIVQWLNAEDLQVDRYARSVSASYRIALRRARLAAIMQPFVMFISYGTLAFVLWRGGRLVQAGELSAGVLVAFLLYTFIVAGAIASMTRLYAQLQQALGASRRLFDLLDERSDVTDPSDPVELLTTRGRITYEGVGFRYSDRHVDVLDSIDLDVQPGEVVALVGPSGSGKSTLAALLPRFYDPTAGHIRLDGVDIRTLRVADLRSQMAAVPQDTYLFSGSIADNLRLGRADATDTELREAATAANAHDFVTAFPQGYDTIVGERGIKLSGGQRQRVAIARALLKAPRILVLDEATSALDAESESLVQEALEALMRDRTTLVIAHRLSTVRNADRILVLNKGRIIQQGSHEQLISVPGLYATLYATQFEGL